MKKASVEYTEQLAHDIRFYLSCGQFDYTQFETLEKKTIKWNDMSVTFGILAESHYFEIKRDTDILNEICACADAQFDTTQDIIQAGYLAKLNTNTVKNDFLNLSYSFIFEYFDWGDGNRKLHELEASCNEAEISCDMIYYFPSDNSNLDDPVTALFLHHGDELNLNTIHSYPNERKIVHTKSILTFKK